LSNPVRIAMWSGPRNISTAMMRAWENRTDTTVWDEPLYGHYLAHTGIDHPMREEVIGATETDWRQIVDQLAGPVPGGKSIYFQKHMTLHLMDHIDRRWMENVVNCFLIRDPAEVIASYAAKRDKVTAADVGFEAQLEIFRHVEKCAGKIPVVLDARDVLKHPDNMLQKLCAAVGVEFDEDMLSWPAGRRDSDGIWGVHWYGAVENSTGFAPYKPSDPGLDSDQSELAAKCRPFYDELYHHRIQPS
jgi:hypothetical protein